MYPRLKHLVYQWTTDWSNIQHLYRSWFSVIQSSGKLAEINGVGLENLGYVQLMKWQFIHE